MKKLLLALSLFSCFNLSYAEETWVKSSSKDESGKEYQVYSLLSLNKNSQNQQVALILISPKENLISKLGFAPTQGAIDCPNYCQYFVQFDNTAAKYTFSIENKSIKLQESQNSDFINNVKNSKEMILILNKQRFYFNVENPNWKFNPDVKKN